MSNHEEMLQETIQDALSTSVSIEELRKDDNNTKQRISKKIEEFRTLIKDMEKNYLSQKNKLQINSIQSDLNQSIGIRCIKFSNNEYIFEFPILEQGVQIEPYTIQLFNHNNKAELGKIQIPIGINVKRILEETPLDDVSNASIFLKNCKSYIDVYHERKRQYMELKSFVQNSRNCFVDSNYNYTLINLELSEVCDLNKNKCYNITFYLLYDLASQKPTKIKFDSRGKKVENYCLKTWSEYFLSFNFKEALNKIDEDPNSSLQWNLKPYTDYEEESDSSDLEEGTTLSRKQGSTRSLKRLKSSKKNTVAKESSSRIKKGHLIQINSKKNRNKQQGKNSKLLKTMHQTTLHLYAENKKDKVNEKSKTIETNENFKSNIKSMNMKLRSQLREKTMNDEGVSTSTPIEGRSKSIFKKMKENFEISNISPGIPKNTPNKGVKKKTKNIGIKDKLRKKN